MFKKMLNHATLELTIQPKGPLLIKSGVEGGADPSLPDMRFVRSRGQVYLPGSSLKGIFRSYAEKIARTVGAKCCNLFDESFCGKKANDSKVNEGAKIYSDRNYACRICQLFGSTAMASRIKFTDAYLLEGDDPTTEVRTGVAIDRVLGSVAQGPFDFEVVTRGKFKTSLHLRNFELWQLGLLGLVLRDMEEGLVPIGFGKSRGFGEVDVKVNSFTVRYFVNDRNLTDFVEKLYGIGALAKEDRRSYGLSELDEIVLENQGEKEEGLYGTKVSFEEKARKEIFRKCVNERWKEVVKNDNSSR